ncbi:MAG TPA: NUDIX domain-containing protein [Candidatus Bathyarchaeia archaeon]|nr:NUDIX domain-containing protein [Candidatus Bathyarchaeia archaeon]
MNITEAIAFLNKKIPNRKKSLPEEVFFFISGLTPLVNVDLLIKDEDGQTLLSWRDDQLSGQGWHLPGGIVRYKETLETRLKKVAQAEVGVEVSFDPIPIAVNQFINHKRDVRSHFVSILFKCFLTRTFIPINRGLKETDPGYLKWHGSCPRNLLGCHHVYKDLI